MKSYGPAAAVARKASPVIRHLCIERFRGLSSLSWHPAERLNVILGGGDVGKTTILEAIALLLRPTNAAAVADTDYHARNVEAGFLIEATVSLPASSGISNQVKPSWPWQWNGEEAVVPALGAAPDSISDPVYRLRVRGTEDLELAYEILQPDDDAGPLTVGLRRSIGLVRLGGYDRAARDLRLVRGSALDRLLWDSALRSRIASSLADADVEKTLADGAKEALETLDDAFKQQGLPDRLGLSITGSPGPSIASMVGLTSGFDEVRLPLTSWGTGTRRLAALVIAEQNQGEAPITIVDELERGLEPYRQRALVEKLQVGGGQAFVTTHSPSVIGASSSSRYWYVNRDGRPGALKNSKTGRHRARDPEAYLARLVIVAEGRTEVGFSSSLLERALGSRLEQHGVHVSDGGGHEESLGLLEGLADAGVNAGGFVDDEGRFPGRWRRVMQAQGPVLFRWSSGCVEENVIGAIPDDLLERLVADPTGEKGGTRQRHLADRLGVEDKSFGALRLEAGTRLREVIIDAALGRIPEGIPEDERKRYKSQSQAWFKSETGGRELAQKMFSLRAWRCLSPQLMPFCNAVRGAAGLCQLRDLES